MKNKILWFAGASLLSLALVFVACEGPDQPVYDSDHPDPNPTGKNPATITAINPASGYFSETVTITGTNFNPDPTKDLVKFGNRVGTIVNATSTELTVITPGIIGDSVDVSVAIAGSEYWSDPVGFFFKPLPETNDLQVIDEEISWPNGVAIDADENIYIGSANDEMIYKITPDGDKSEFAPALIHGALHFGPGGYLYVCQKDEGNIIRISPDGSTSEDVVDVENPVDFDWDADGNMYIVSDESAVSLFADGTLTELAEVSTAKNVRVFENSLYVSAIWDGTIWKFDITPDGLENQEAVYEGDSPSSFDFASNGLMVLAEAWEISLYTLFQDGSMGPLMYEEELETPMRYMVWHGKSLYIVYPGWADVGKTLKVYIGLEQAPRYGEQ
jgi:hypothetical protein